MDRHMETWLRNVLLTSSLTCTELRLEHHTAGSESPIASTRIDPEVDKEEQIQKALKLFRETAERHAMEFPRAQRYAIVALGEGHRVIASNPFRMKPPSFAQETGGESEPPDHRGVIGLELRSAEMLLRMAIESQHAIMTQQGKLLESMMTRNAALEEARMRDFDAREELLGKTHERQIEFMQIEMQEQRKDRLFKKAEGYLAPLVPEILEKLKLLPKGNGAARDGVSKLHAFLSTLSEDQQTAMMKTLTPEQAAMLVGLLPEEEKTDERAS